MNSPTFSNLVSVCAANHRRALRRNSSDLERVRAQPAASGVDSRFLLIFDTSSAMKARVPATQYAVERLFFSMMNGQLQPGDSIGVWTFDRELRTGEFPLQRWLPQNAATIASGITNFVGTPALFQKARALTCSCRRSISLVQNSRAADRADFLRWRRMKSKGRRTTTRSIRFSSKTSSALKKADQTFIVVLRAQFGQYTGYTVNSSAIGVNFPEFPPLPAPPQPVAPAQTNRRRRHRRRTGTAGRHSAAARDYRAPMSAPICFLPIPAQSRRCIQSAAGQSGIKPASHRRIVVNVRRTHRPTNAAPPKMAETSDQRPGAAGGQFRLEPQRRAGHWRGAAGRGGRW